MAWAARSALFVDGAHLPDYERRSGRTDVADTPFGPGASLGALAYQPTTRMPE